MLAKLSPESTDWWPLMGSMSMATSCLEAWHTFVGLSRLACSWNIPGMVTDKGFFLILPASSSPLSSAAVPCWSDFSTQNLADSLHDCFYHLFRCALLRADQSIQDLRGSRCGFSTNQFLGSSHLCVDSLLVTLLMLSIYITCMVSQM